MCKSTTLTTTYSCPELYSDIQKKVAERKDKKRKSGAIKIMVIPDNLIPIIDEMYYELSTEKLEVCLIPNNDEQKPDRLLRAAISVNPQWYRELCLNYPCTRIKKRTARKDYTKIKRKDILYIYIREYD